MTKKITKKTVIYTQNTCGYCKAIKDEFVKNDIEFDERLISEYKDEWGEVVKLTNIAATPTICFEENYFIPGRDFNNPQNLINTLNNYKSYGNVSLFEIAEKIKTLNYNMGMAFGRLDQSIKTIEQKLEKDVNINDTKKIE